MIRLVLLSCVRAAQAAACVALAAGLARALPADPQRPMAARDCPEALTRLAEARAGSPLISGEENAAVLIAALKQARRLCGEAAADQTPPGE